MKEDISLHEVESYAQDLYYCHMCLDSVDFKYMWDQCSQDYKEAWKVIARTDLQRECSNV